jgi:hypothetical protein
MIANLALMGGYFSHQQAIDNATEDIQTILREKMIGLPIKGGKLRVGSLQFTLPKNLAYKKT